MHPRARLARAPIVRSMRSMSGLPCSAALESVSLVVAFDEHTPLHLVIESHPDIIVKGGDYDVESTVGAAEVLAWGGTFKAIPIVEGRSTSALVQKIRG